MSEADHTPYNAHTTLKEHRYQTALKVDHFDMIADEPEDLGGNDEGPRPVSLLLAALGACTGITLRMCTERKDWPLEGIEVELFHERKRVDEYDGELPEGAKGLFDYIKMKVTIDGEELDEAQIERIEVIAGNCPVHRILSNPLVIDTGRNIKSVSNSTINTCTYIYL
ncbi:MAG: OsmC family protein [Bacteroidota bacterium]|nr:OsmC family protein [Bacteroidota bacterium]